jgi:hypothetical protein
MVGGVEFDALTFFIVIKYLFLNRYYGQKFVPIESQALKNIIWESGIWDPEKTSRTGSRGQKSRVGDPDQH